MFQKKCIVILVVVGFLIFICYVYHEVITIKKLLVPAYQKTMALENKFNIMEKQNIMKSAVVRPPKKQDTPILSITYQSDVTKNGDLSALYMDLTDNEIKEVKEDIGIGSIQSLKNDEFSKDGVPIKINDQSNYSEYIIGSELDPEGTECFSIKISDKKESLQKILETFDELDNNVVKSITNGIKNKKNSQL